MPEIPGTKQSIKTFSLLTPSGIPSLDTLTGGGFPIGTVIVANASNEEARGYSKVVLHHFLGQVKMPFCCVLGNTEVGAKCDFEI